jgi:SAM-dependent methyltransferase
VNETLRNLVRPLWHAYLKVNQALAPSLPTVPEYWMERVQKALCQEPKFVLDFGGGPGVYKAHLVRKGDRYVILEPSALYVRNEHQYVIGDGLTPLFQQQSFEVITMFEVLEHLPNPFKAFENCATWLKPNGILVISTPQYWHVHGWPSDYFRYTCYGLTELARVAGLEVEDLWPMGGPCLMIWSAVELNFPFLRYPLIQQLVTYPAQLLAKISDRLLFSNNLARKNPDTRGWMMIARKPA